MCFNKCPLYLKYCFICICISMNIKKTVSFLFLVQVIISQQNLWSCFISLLANNSVTFPRVIWLHVYVGYARVSLCGDSFINKVHRKYQKRIRRARVLRRGVRSRRKRTLKINRRPAQGYSRPAPLKKMQLAPLY